MPLKEVTGMELTKREVQGKQVDVVKIDHMENTDVVTSYILCPISTLQILINFLKDTTKDLEVNPEELDPLSAQVGMLIYSGMDSHAIENMLNISHKDLDEIYNKLLKIGLIDVVFVRKEVQLTPKGVRFITDSVKPPSP
ncbi:MAG: Chemotaxis signal transduction system protein F from archaea [Methanoregulaceae archaeon PtaU1.Bin222]|nr:MAG: Chemotaxis signal transduction system protein F from archaea [Methanoregulaceae archaeon PtaU1.Bin222]